MCGRRFWSLLVSPQEKALVWSDKRCGSWSLTHGCPGANGFWQKNSLHLVSQKRAKRSEHHFCPRQMMDRCCCCDKKECCWQKVCVVPAYSDITLYIKLFNYRNSGVTAEKNIMWTSKSGVTAERHVDNRRYSGVTAQIHEVIKVDKKKLLYLTLGLSKSKKKQTNMILKQNQNKSKYFTKKR